MNYFHKNLIFIINKQNLKKSEFSNKIGISKQLLNDYLKKNHYPNYDILIKISNELLISIDDLLKKDLESENY